MDRFLTLNRKVAFAGYAMADLVSVGMGMGVPIFCIALGFPVGWYIAMSAIRGNSHVTQTLRTVLLHAVAACLVTFVLMALLWGPTILLLFDPTFDVANFGHPDILYDPTLSFVGWLVLMIFVSPFLQLLTTLFSSYLTLSVSLKEESRAV
ncbi:MAG: hypothetical protein GTO63_03895 [Anaerolineae bacterium]|nr:hypothetical protein [Anaerolineae bacterium]NIN94155.1 hypothetical protein [Anaerolineae bacterium]NIQ77197.1 hypothetical protein [Anaerolineae bacterium]